MKYTRPIPFLLIALTLLSSCGKNKSDIGDERFGLRQAAVVSSAVTMSSALPVSSEAVTRIVSFAPNITEILYELGLGDRVCGVTRFCKYPPEAAQKEKIGGQTDHNYEAVVRLEPDLAIILKEQRDMIAFFDSYSIRYITVGSDSLEEILESIQSVADACSVSDNGKTIVDDLRKRIGLASIGVGSDKTVNTDKIVNANQIVNKTNAVNTDNGVGADNKPKVLLCVSRDNMGTGAIGKCYIAGAASFYDQLIDAAGGVNVMKGIRQAYPTITAEAVIRLAPDVIIDISMFHTDNKQTQKVCSDWKALKSVPAVKNNRVYCMTGDYLTIPGPRIGLILEDLKNAVRQR